MALDLIFNGDSLTYERAEIRDGIGLSDNVLTFTTLPIDDLKLGSVVTSLVGGRTPEYVVESIRIDPSSGSVSVTAREEHNEGALLAKLLAARLGQDPIFNVVFAATDDTDSWYIRERLGTSERTYASRLWGRMSTDANEAKRLATLIQVLNKYLLAVDIGIGGPAIVSDYATTPGTTIDEGAVITGDLTINSDAYEVPLHELAGRYEGRYVGGTVVANLPTVDRENLVSVPENDRDEYARLFEAVEAIGVRVIRDYMEAYTLSLTIPQNTALKPRSAITFEAPDDEAVRTNRWQVVSTTHTSTRTQTNESNTTKLSMRPLYDDTERQVFRHLVRLFTPPPPAGILVRPTGGTSYITWSDADPTISTDDVSGAGPIQATLCRLQFETTDPFTGAEGEPIAITGNEDVGDAQNGGLLLGGLSSSTSYSVVLTNENDMGSASALERFDTSSDWPYAPISVTARKITDALAADPSIRSLHFDASDYAGDLGDLSYLPPVGADDITVMGLVDLDQNGVPIPLSVGAAITEGALRGTVAVVKWVVPNSLVLGGGLASRLTSPIRAVSSKVGGYGTAKWVIDSRLGRIASSAARPLSYTAGAVKMVALGARNAALGATGSAALSIGSKFAGRVLSAARFAGSRINAAFWAVTVPIDAYRLAAWIRQSQAGAGWRDRGVLVTFNIDPNGKQITKLNDVTTQIQSSQLYIRTRTRNSRAPFGGQWSTWRKYNYNNMGVSYGGENFTPGDFSRDDAAYPNIGTIYHMPDGAVDFDSAASNVGGRSQADRSEAVQTFVITQPENVQYQLALRAQVDGRWTDGTTSGSSTEAAPPDGPRSHTGDFGDGCIFSPAIDFDFISPRPKVQSAQYRPKVDELRFSLYNQPLGLSINKVVDGIPSPDDLSYSYTWGVVATGELNGLGNMRYVRVDWDRPNFAGAIDSYLVLITWKDGNTRAGDEATAGTTPAISGLPRAVLSPAPGTVGSGTNYPKMRDPALYGAPLSPPRTDGMPDDMGVLSGDGGPFWYFGNALSVNNEPGMLDWANRVFDGDVYRPGTGGFNGFAPPLDRDFYERAAIESPADESERQYIYRNDTDLFTEKEFESYLWTITGTMNELQRRAFAPGGTHVFVPGWDHTFSTPYSVVPPTHTIIPVPQSIFERTKDNIDPLQVTVIPIYTDTIQRGPDGSVADYTVRIMGRPTTATMPRREDLANRLIG